MHFCHEEIFALLALIPGIKYGIAWLQSRFHRKHKCECIEANNALATQRIIK
ncbi:MAG: hypothetical protein UT24_C0037G0014 [Candidatus Woesebacteria bacterium GW2011_GWB1_39_12]|uniref:Uncharacterized protein n=1 Tax=Candidatus Woesebacteria bacterium GW2011_GWB1_39_12 TaxID=1618574 RepID=A0A0G0MED2_9BACT|nr:MAG: hypothetical protein UT24_C0037G0014 [Candidatus Woesebacteria bacterium GW2011_GWB1_39_12]